MGDDLDYQRFGRQIALPEVGARGQRALAVTHVSFRGGPTAALAERYHSCAGGAVGDDATNVVVDVPFAGDDRVSAIGIAAWSAVEAARRVLGQAPREFPLELAERLSTIAVRE